MVMAASTSTSRDHIAILQRLLERKAAKEMEKRDSYSGPRRAHEIPSRISTSHALSIPSTEMTSEVVELFTTSYWSDDAGRPYLPQSYHMDCGRTNGKETDNIRTWARVLVGTPDMTRYAELPPKEIMVIRASGAVVSSSSIASVKNSKILSLEEEQVRSEAPSASGRRLLRLTDAACAALTDSSSSSGLRLRAALEEILWKSRNNLSDSANYMRLLRLHWPTSCSNSEIMQQEPGGTGRAESVIDAAAAQASRVRLRKFLETVKEPLGASTVRCARIIKPFTFCELFAGLGGFRIALEALGGECVFASEINPVCQSVYAGRWNEKKPGEAEVGNPNHQARATCASTRTSSSGLTTGPNYVPGPAAAKADSIPASGPGRLHGDITKIPCSSIPNHDLLVGGFPCQPFSRLGNQDAFDEKRGRGVLYLEILRILKEKRPKMFLLENVPGIADEKEGGSFSSCVFAENTAGEDESRFEGQEDASDAEPKKKRRKLDTSSPLRIILSDLALDGLYNVQAKMYSSASLTAQQRKRVYFVGVLREEGKKKRKIRFPDAALIPDLGLVAGDVINFWSEQRDTRTSEREPRTTMQMHSKATACGAGCQDEQGDADAGRQGGSGKGSGKKGGRRKAAVGTDCGRSLRLSPAQFQKLWPKLPSLQRQGKNLFIYPTTTKLGPVVSHYGHSPGHGNCQLVARPADSVEGGVPRLLSAEECLRVMGMNPDDFLPKMQTDWIPSAVKFPNSKPLIKKSCYHIIGNAVCPPVIAWLAEKVVLPAGGFVEKVASSGSEDEAEWPELPAFLKLALEAVKDVLP